MDKCPYYKGTDLIGTETTKILCSYMTSGGKVFNNKDPEGAALIQCCWHGGANCPIMEEFDEPAPIQNSFDEIPPDVDDEDDFDDEDTTDESQQLQVLAHAFLSTPVMCPYFGDKGKVTVNPVLKGMNFECSQCAMNFVREKIAMEWLSRCSANPEGCIYYRKAKKEEQPMEQQTFTTDVTTSNTQISSERQDRAAKLTQQIIANGKIAASSMIEMGRDLKTVRDERLFTELGFESFEEYCEKKCGIGKRHGYNFIQIYEKFGEEKLKQLQQLGITKLLEIAKLDDEDAEDLMQHNDVNSLSVRELSAKVEEYRNKYEQLTMLLEEEKSKTAESASLESQVEELKKQLEAAKQEKETLREQFRQSEERNEHKSNALVRAAQRYEDETKAYKKQISELESRPAEISEEERNALIQQGRDEMSKEKDKLFDTTIAVAKKTAVLETEKKFAGEIDKLKAENNALREKAERAKESTAKKYEGELEKLKSENAALQSNAQPAPAPAPTSGVKDKVKFYLSQIKAAFNAAAEAMSEADDEERETLKTALKTALERMNDALNS